MNAVRRERRAASGAESARGLVRSREMRTALLILAGALRVGLLQVGLVVTLGCAARTAPQPQHVARFVPPAEPVPVPRAVQLAIGGTHNCVRMSDATVRCWGENRNGQLGDGSQIERHHPVTVSLAHVVDIQVGAGSTCARLETGEVSCWGEQPGLFEATSVPTKLRDRPASLWLGSDAFRARWRRGRPTYGGVFEVSDPSGARVIDDAVALAGDRDFGCVLDAEHDIWCLNTGRHDAFGIGLIIQSVPALTRVEGAAGAVQIAAGTSFACARMGDGTVRCWGTNDDGQLGDGTFTDRASPADVVGLRDVVAIAAAGTTACAVRVDQTIWCWGDAYVGRKQWPRPHRIPLDGVIEVGVADGHACALRDDGTIACWGQGYAGALGDGFQRDHAEPVQVRWQMSPVQSAGLPRGVHVKSLAIDDVRTCAVLTDGTVRCWGHNGGVIDPARADESFVQPVQIPDLNGVAELNLDWLRARAIRADGRVLSWNGDTRPTEQLDHVTHVLANGSLVCVQRTSLVECTARGRTVSIGNAVQMAMSENDPPDPCVALADRTVACLTDTGFAAQPGLRDVVQVAIGDVEEPACARLTDGHVRCWGGAGAPPGPPLARLHDVIDLVAGPFGRCARTSSGTVWCWGHFHTWPNEPTEIPWLRGARQIVLAQQHACAVFGEDVVMCWGENRSGELGDGTMDASPRPTRVRW